MTVAHGSLVSKIHVDMEVRGTGVLVVVSFPLFKHYYHHTNIFIFTSRKAARSYVTVGPGKRYDLLSLTMLISILESQEPYNFFWTVLIIFESFQKILGSHTILRGYSNESFFFKFLANFITTYICYLFLHYNFSLA